MHEDPIWQHVHCSCASNTHGTCMISARWLKHRNNGSQQQGLSHARMHMHARICRRRMDKHGSRTGNAIA